MIILERTGDVFRPLLWGEYKEARIKEYQTGDDIFSENEKRYFDKVIKFCESPEKAMKFSKSWRN